MRYTELKEILYFAITFLGIIFLLAGIYQYLQALWATVPITHMVTSFILCVMGIICVMFGIETYMLRDDPDIWR